MKYLIVSGDSFTNLKFRSTNHPDMDTSWPKWPEILAKKLDMKLICLGSSGQGNEYIYSSLQDTIENIKDKSQIGLVIAAWSQGFRKDFQEKDVWQHTDVSRGNRDASRRGWLLERKALGDVFSWVRRSLRTYLSFQYMCEYHNLPYLQTQMVNLYGDYIKASNGIIKTYHDIENYKDVMAILPAGSYSNQEKDNNIETLLKIIMYYDPLINHKYYIGWPTIKQLGGYSMDRKYFDLDPDNPNIISLDDGHPTKVGNEVLATLFYEHIKQGEIK